MLFPFYGGGGCKRNHPDLSTTTNAQANRKKGCYWGVARGSLYKSLIYFWHHHVMFEEDWKKRRNEVIQEGKTFRKADFKATSEAPKAAQVFWPTPSFSADETLKRIGKKWSYTGGQTFRKADFKAASEAQAVCMCSDLLLTYSKFLSRWDLT